MGPLMTGLSRGSRTPPAVCACAAALNVPRLHRTRAVPKAAIAILMPRPPCYTQLGRNSDILTFEFAPLLSVYRTSKTPEPQRLISLSAHNPDERSGIRGQSYHAASLMRA